MPLQNYLPLLDAIALAEQKSVRVTAYGSNVSAFRKALATLAAQGGGTLEIPKATYRFDSAELALPINIDSNITIIGNGAHIVVTGNAVSASVFGSRDASNIVIRDLVVTGNGRAIDNSASGQFYKYSLTAKATADQGKIKLDNVSLNNFSGNRWISFTNFNEAGFLISDISAHDISIQSRPGNSLRPENIGTWASAIVIDGYRGAITNVDILDFRADARHIKSGIGLLNNVSQAKLSGLYILKAGQYGASDDSGGYAVTIYGKRGALHDISIADATIMEPRSAGIYAAGVDSLTVSGATIVGQTDTQNQTLPKGGLALNGVKDFSVTDSNFERNFVDISIVANVGKTGDSIGRLRNIDTQGATHASIVYNPAAGSGESGELFLMDSRISASGRGIHILNGIAPGRTVKHLSVLHSTVKSTRSHGLDLSPYGIVAGGSYMLNDVIIDAAGAAIHAGKVNGDFHFIDVMAHPISSHPNGIMMNRSSRVKTEMGANVRSSAR